jgi:hypothetical protein
MEFQACSVHNFLITSGIWAFTREFRAFTREFRTFTLELRFTRIFCAFNRGFRAFIREFHAFTREFHAFTREFHAFTREFRILPDIFFSLFSFSKRKGQSLSALSLFLFSMISSGQPFYDGGQKK